MPLFVQNQEHNFCYHLYYRCDILSQLTQTEFFFFSNSGQRSRKSNKSYVPGGHQQRSTFSLGTTEVVYMEPSSGHETVMSELEETTPEV